MPRMTASKVWEAREAYQDAQDAYLRQRGWNHTSNNPACMWLWYKPLPDADNDFTMRVIVMVDRDTAVNMQECADSISLKCWPKPL